MVIMKMRLKTVPAWSGDASSSLTLPLAGSTYSWFKLNHDDDVDVYDDDDDEDDDGDDDVDENGLANIFQETMMRWLAL